MDKKFDVVLFDLGNVLVHIDVLNFPRALGFRDIKVLEPIAPAILLLQQKYEKGEVTTETFFQCVAEMLPHSYTREELERAFSTIICEPVEGMENIVAQLSRLYQTALVSNTSEFHYTQSLRQVPAIHFLTKHYTSYTLKALKPEDAFYAAVLKDLQCPAERVVFIDDLQQNVEGARKSGMVSIQFFSSSQLLDELKTIGLEF